jgi:hypothetical protein
MGYDKPKDASTEEREDNGASMSDERELDDEMKREYSGNAQAEKAVKLNDEERERAEGSKMNEEEV